MGTHFKYEGVRFREGISGIEGVCFHRGISERGQLALLIKALHPLTVPNVKRKAYSLTIV